MKSFKKNGLSMLLCMAMLFGLLPITQTNANAAVVSEDEIQSRIDALCNLLDGKYFTTGQSACTDASHKNAICKTCYNAYVFSSPWFKELFGTVSTNQLPGIGVTANASSCAGFANFAEWYIFKTNASDTVSANLVKKVAFTKENMTTYAKIGDAIRWKNSHSFIFIRANASTVTVLDCNWAWNGSQVQKHEISYDSGTTADIYRATNRSGESAGAIADRTASSNVTFYSLTTPSNLTVGSVGHIDGRIKSTGSPMTEIKAWVYGKSPYTLVLRASTSGFNLYEYGPINNSKLDADLKFETLPEGVYFVRYTVTTADGAVRTEDTEDFKVVGAHVHSYAEGYEAAHPHRIYMMCSCGEYYYTGATKTLNTCTICNPPHVHALTRIATKAATETTEGNIEYWYCAGCDKYFSDANASNEITQAETVTTKLTHTHAMAHTASKTATETAEGNIEYWYCADCSKYFSDSDAKVEITKNQTVIPKLNHTHKLEKVIGFKPTCTLSGCKDFWVCYDCKTYFSDQSGSSIVKEADTFIAPLGHNYSNGICTRCGESDPNYVKPKSSADVHFEKKTLFTQGQFTDVPANQWFTNKVAEAVELGLMKGSGTAFNPYGDVTLAEAITMAARINSIYNTGSGSFTQAGTWYQVYLDYAYQNGIISNAYYNADVTRKATRAQFAEIFANCLPEEALAAINTVADNAIPDVSAGTSFAPYVYRLYRAGILTGSDAARTFSPQAFITRAEAAAIVSRMAESDNRVSFTLQ